MSSSGWRKGGGDEGRRIDLVGAMPGLLPERGAGGAAGGSGWHRRGGDGRKGRRGGGRKGTWK